MIQNPSEKKIVLQKYTTRHSDASGPIHAPMESSLNRYSKKNHIFTCALVSQSSVAYIQLRQLLTRHYTARIVVWASERACEQASVSEYVRVSVVGMIRLHIHRFTLNEHSINALQL